MRHGNSCAFWNYVWAVLLVFAAVCLNLLLTRKIEPSAAPLLFAAVLIASWIGGWGAGLLATALAGAADDFFFIPPIHSWTFNLTVVVRLAVFLMVSLLTSYLTSQRERLLIAERRARVEAEEANCVKDRFLAVTSHELRTPLTAICMWLDVVEHNESKDSLQEGAEIIRNSADAIRRMVDDLLDVSRIAAGKLRLDMHPLDLAKPVRAAVDALRPRALAKQLEIDMSLNPPPGLVNADPSRIEQVVANLLVNAIKFTPEGGRITVRLAYTAVSAELRVKDTGRGIAAKDLPNVFKEFWQGTNLDVGGEDGLGLGLSIVRELVRLQRGSINVQSEGKGTGTMFIVDLPLAIQEMKGIQYRGAANAVRGQIRTE